MVHGKRHDSPTITPTNFIDYYLFNKIVPNAQYEHSIENSPFQFIYKLVLYYESLDKIKNKKLIKKYIHFEKEKRN